MLLSTQNARCFESICKRARSGKAVLGEYRWMVEWAALEQFDETQAQFGKNNLLTPKRLLGSKK